MELKVKKLHVDAKLPTYAQPGDAGLDLTAIDDGTYSAAGYREYGTAIAVEIPEGHVGLVFPRSSISTRGMVLCNGVGVIDSGYRGEITCRFQLLNGEHTKLYRRGERIAQLVVLPLPTWAVVEADTLATSQRGGGGYGSTGA
jgi:dUTP pyrophosphatase